MASVAVIGAGRVGVATGADMAEQSRRLDVANVFGSMTEPRIVDAGNPLDPATVFRRGLHCNAIGRA